MNEFTESQLKVLDALQSLSIAKRLYQINTIGNPYNQEMSGVLNKAYNDIFDELTKDIGKYIIKKHKMLGNT